MLDFVVERLTTPTMTQTRHGIAGELSAQNVGSIVETIKPDSHVSLDTHLVIALTDIGESEYEYQVLTKKNPNSQKHNYIWREISNAGGGVAFTSLEEAVEAFVEPGTIVKVVPLTSIAG